MAVILTEVCAAKPIRVPRGVGPRFPIARTKFMCSGFLECGRVSRNDRVTFRADLTVRARKHTDKSGLLKMGGVPNSAEISYLSVALGSHNAEVEGSSPSLTTKNQALARAWF